MAAPKTRYCPSGHDKDVVGRKRDGSCMECIRIRSKANYVPIRRWNMERTTCRAGNHPWPESRKVKGAGDTGYCGVCEKERLARAYIKYYFKMDPDEHLSLRAAKYVEQEGCCAICRTSYPEPPYAEREAGAKYLSFDHDHVTGALRGLICHNCNRGIGNLQDSPEYLRAAADYLESFALEA